MVWIGICGDTSGAPTKQCQSKHLRQPIYKGVCGWTEALCMYIPAETCRVNQGLSVGGRINERQARGRHNGQWQCRRFLLPPPSITKWSSFLWCHALSELSSGAMFTCLAVAGGRHVVQDGAVFPQWADPTCQQLPTGWTVPCQQGGEGGPFAC